MAKIGLNNFWYSVATFAGDGTFTYGTPASPGKAVTFSFTPTLADAELYADDTLQEVDNQVTGADVTLGIDRSDDTTMNALLGHTFGVGDAAATQISSTNDVAPYVGVGRVTRLMQDNVQKFRATVIKLIKFSEPSEEDNTRGESVTFNTYELQGKMKIPADGNWRVRETFDTLQDAVDFVKGQLSAGTQATVTFDKNSATGTTPAAITTFEGATITLPGVGDMTKSGKVFDGWDSSSTAAHADLHTTYNVTGSVTLYAIWVDPA